MKIGVEIYKFCENRGKFINFVEIGVKMQIHHAIYIIGLGGMDASALCHQTITSQLLYFQEQPMNALVILLKSRSIQNISDIKTYKHIRNKYISETLPFQPYLNQLILTDSLRLWQVQLLCLNNN